MSGRPLIYEEEMERIFREERLKKQNSPEIREMAKSIRIVRRAAGLLMDHIAERFEKPVSYIESIEHGIGTLGQTRLVLMGTIKSAADSDGPWFEETDEESWFHGGE